MSDAALAKIITDYERKLEQAKLKARMVEQMVSADKKSAKAICEAKLEGAAAKRGACLRDLDRRDKLLTKTLDKCQASPWYRSPQLHFVLGGLVVGGVCVAASRIE